MAPAYEIAELRRLRTSASDSTIALEKAVKEDAVKGTTLFITNNTEALSYTSHTPACSLYASDAASQFTFDEIHCDLKF